MTGPIIVPTRAVIDAEIRKLDDLEIDVRRAFDTGQVNGLALTSAQLVAVMQERRRIIVARSIIEGVMPTESQDDGHA